MELKVKLKQHTPIIHFQWDQEGATLRATEVKPKLDKFLIKKDSFLNGAFGEKGSLPYKLRIFSTNKNEYLEEIDNKNFPSFFGNLRSKEKGNQSRGESNQPRYKFIFYNDLELQFLSFEPEILDAIKNNIAEFFFRYNFGARQSKGFGSFYIHESDETYKEPDSFTKEPKQITKYYFDLNIESVNFYKKYKDLFSDIDLFYRTLRSGINRKGETDFYFKSIMFLYAKQKGWTWDKKAIKEKFVDEKILKNQMEKHNSPDILTFKGKNEYLVRDLLGVAPLQHYFYYNPYLHLSYNFYLQYDEKNKIQRFQSPIIFKPIATDENNFRVYLILNHIPDEMFNKKFKINKIPGNPKNDFKELFTPPRFDIEDFLKFAISLDIANHVEQKYHEKQKNDKNYYHIIYDIYSSLKKNIQGGSNGK
jgi:hypothetical protein